MNEFEKPTDPPSLRFGRARATDSDKGIISRKVLTVELSWV